MVHDGWIHRKHKSRVSLELILMYQHGVMPIEENGLDLINDQFLNITVSGQIKERQLMISRCEKNGCFMDYFEEALAEVCKQQIEILMKVKNLLIVQYN